MTDEQISLSQVAAADVPSGAAVKLQSDTRLTSKLGFPGSAYLSASGVAAMLWDDAGNLVFARGAPAAVLGTMSSGASTIGSVTLGEPAPLVVGQTPVVLATPHESEDPASFLARLTDIASLQTWVMNSGVPGPHASAWADFASAMGWKQPPGISEAIAPEEKEITDVSSQQGAELSAPAPLQ